MNIESINTVCDKILNWRERNLKVLRDSRVVSANLLRKYLSAQSLWHDDLMDAISDEELLVDEVGTLYSEILDDFDAVWNSIDDKRYMDARSQLGDIVHKLKLLPTANKS